MKKETLTGIILAGGESSRFNYVDKGLILLGEQRCIRYVINVIKPLVDDLMIVSNNREYEQFGYPVYPDSFTKIGPVGGLYAGLQNSKSEKNLVLACDMPCLNTAFLSTLISYSDSDICIPYEKNRMQPLCGVYKKSISLKLHSLILKNERRMRYIIDQFDSKKFEIHQDEPWYHPRLFFNMNTPNERDILIREVI